MTDKRILRTGSPRCSSTNIEHGARRNQRRVVKTIASRNGHEGHTLDRLCREHAWRSITLSGRPDATFFKRRLHSGHLFLFAGRGKDRLKILYWDSDGFAIWYKRLEEGTFRLPTPKVDATKEGASTGAGVELKASELAMLLTGIDMTSIKRRKRFALDTTRTHSRSPAAKPRVASRVARLA